MGGGGNLNLLVSPIHASIGFYTSDGGATTGGKSANCDVLARKTGQRHRFQRQKYLRVDHWYSMERS